MRENSLSRLVLVGVMVAVVAGLATLVYYTFLSSPCSGPTRKAAIASGTYLAASGPEDEGRLQRITWIDGSTERRITVDRAAQRVRISYRRKDGRQVVETWRITHQYWRLSGP